MPGGSQFVTMTIYAAYDPVLNPFGKCAVKNWCNNSGTDPVSNACPHVGMPYRSIGGSSSNTQVIVAYPYFGVAQGSVRTLLPNFHSLQLHNYRDINVYVPTSLIQNPLPRIVNFLIVNDGTLYYLEQLSFAGGLDHAQLTGSVPETVLIGVPQNDTGSQREFELTFSKKMSCPSCPSGGTDLYLSFVKDNVVPMAAAALDVYPPGEVSMMGASHGGLTSCYAAAAQPEYFRRVFCQSPSTWWNYGELASVVKMNAAASVAGPIAVVVYIGTTEMGAPLCSSLKCDTVQTWFTFVNETVEAFRMARYAGGKDVVDLHFFTLSGGQHDVTAWATTFARGVVQMFAANFTSKYQMQYVEGSAINVVYPLVQPANCSGGVSDGVSIGWVVLLVVLLAVETMGVVAVVWCVLQRRKKSAEHDVLNPLGVAVANEGGQVQ